MALPPGGSSGATTLSRSTSTASSSAPYGHSGESVAAFDPMGRRAETDYGRVDRTVDVRRPVVRIYTPIAAAATASFRQKRPSTTLVFDDRSQLLW